AAEAVDQAAGLVARGDLRDDILQLGAPARGAHAARVHRGPRGCKVCGGARCAGILARVAFAGGLVYARRVRIALLLLALAFPVAAATEPGEQAVTPVAPAGEQRVEPVAPPAQQQVTVVSADAAEQVQPVSHNPARRVASGAAKVALAVVGAGIALGATIAELLFL